MDSFFKENSSFALLERTGHLPPRSSCATIFWKLLAVSFAANCRKITRGISEKWREKEKSHEKIASNFSREWKVQKNAKRSISRHADDSENENSTWHPSATPFTASEARRENRTVRADLGYWHFTEFQHWHPFPWQSAVWSPENPEIIRQCPKQGEMTFHFLWCSNITADLHHHGLHDTVSLMASLSQHIADTGRSSWNDYTINRLLNIEV